MLPACVILTKVMSLRVQMNVYVGELEMKLVIQWPTFACVNIGLLSDFDLDRLQRYEWTYCMQLSP